MADYVPLSGIPETGGSVEQSIAKITDYLFQLQEQDRYMWYNLGVENLNGNSLKELGDIIREPVEFRLSNDEGQIVSLGVSLEGVTGRLSDAEGSITELGVTSSELSVRMGNAEGSIAELTFTSAGMATRLSSAEGNISTLEQTASGLTSTVTSLSGSVTTLQQTTSGLSVDVESLDGEIHNGANYRFTSAGLNIFRGGLRIYNAAASDAPASSTKVFEVDTSGNLFYKGTIKSGSTVTGTDINGSTITGNTISGGTISGTTISASTITGNTIVGGTLGGGTITGATINGSNINAYSESANTGFFLRRSASNYATLLGSIWGGGSYSSVAPAMFIRTEAGVSLKLEAGGVPDDNNDGNFSVNGKETYIHGRSKTVITAPEIQITPTASGGMVGLGAPGGVLKFQIYGGKLEAKFTTTGGTTTTYAFTPD